jgi:hypothetical protein
MKYLVLHAAGFIQTTIHVTIDDVFKKFTRYFLNNSDGNRSHFQENNRSWKGPQRNSSN